MPSQAEIVARNALDQINELELRFAVIEERIFNLSKNLDEVSLRTLAEKLAVVEDRVTELKRLKEESEKRHWQFVYIFAGAVATLLVTVIVQLVIAWVRK